MNWLQSVRERYSVAVDPLRTERRIELAAVMLTLFLVLQLIYGGARLAILSDPEVIPPAADSLQVTSSLGPKEILAQRSNEIRNRPLLWAERRPIEPVAIVSEPEEVKVEELQGVKLLGVFGAGDSAGIIALVDGKMQRLRLGDEVNGWTLESAQEKEAVFVAGERQSRLSLLPQAISANKADKKTKGRK